MWKNETENEQVDLTPFIDPLVILAGLLMILMPTIQSFHLEKSELVQYDHGSASTVEAENELVLLEFTEDSILYQDQDRNYSFDELQDLIQAIPAGSSILLAGDAMCSYRKSLLLKTALSQAGFQIQELSTLKGDE